MLYVNDHGKKIYIIDEQLRILFDAIGFEWTSTPECEAYILRENVYRMGKQRLLTWANYETARPLARGAGKRASYWKITPKAVVRLLDKFVFELKMPPDVKVEVAKIILRGKNG